MLSYRNQYDRYDSKRHILSITGKRPSKPLYEQFRDLPHGQVQTQRGLLERLKVKMPIEALGPLILSLHNHRHGRDLLRRFQTAVKGIYQQELPLQELKKSPIKAPFFVGSSGRPY
jgi:hypothetical protein